MTNLHVAMFVDTYKPVADGVVGVVSNCSRLIHERHGRALVVAPEQKNQNDDDPFPVIRFPSVPIVRANEYRLSLAPELALRQMKRVMSTPLDILHAHSPFRMGELALKVAGLRHLPVVSTFHSQYRDDFLNITKSSLLAELGVDVLVHRFWNRVPYMIVPTEFSGRILNDYGWEGEYRVLPNGSDMIPPSTAQLAESRREGGRLLGVPDHLPVLLFVGQHRWVKNPIQILETAAILKTQGIDFVQVFIGGGRDAPDIVRKAKDLGIGDRVRFMGVIKDREILSRFYARADLFTFPSTYDVDPLVVKEAAAWYTPSIVARESSSAERITDCVNGFLTGPDPREMAALISGLLKRPERLRQAGVEARRTVYLPWDAVVVRLIETYREIIEDWRVRQWERYHRLPDGHRERPVRMASRRSESLRNKQQKRIRHKLDLARLVPVAISPKDRTKRSGGTGHSRRRR